MNKQEFFYEPKTKMEILDRRSVKRVSRNIADKVLELGDREGLIIPEIVPEDFPSRMRFLKRASLVVLDTGKTSWQAMKENRTPLQARREASQKLKKGEKYCGMVWRSLRKNTHKRVSLVNSIRGSHTMM